MFVCLFAKGGQSGGQAIHSGESPAGEGKESLRRRSQSEGNFPKTHREMRRGGRGQGEARVGLAQKLRKKWHIYVTCTFQWGGRGGKHNSNSEKFSPPRDCWGKVTG